MNPILAIDFGRARIGAAISDELQLLAHPLETIPANEQAPARVAQIVREKKVDHVVTGLPKRMNGQIGAAATVLPGVITAYCGRKLALSNTMCSFTAPLVFTYDAHSNIETQTGITVASNVSSGCLKRNFRFFSLASSRHTAASLSNMLLYNCQGRCSFA